MNREHHHWHSPALNRQMDLLVYGFFGRPIIVFPSAQGRYYDYENNGMINSIAGSIHEGRVKVFCVDGIDSESWFNSDVSPDERVRRHLDYERYIMDELFPFMDSHCNANGIKAAATGSSFGAYHAINFALKFPQRFSHVLCLSGNYDIRNHLGGDYPQDFYYNNPVDYLPNLEDHEMLEAIREVQISLIVGQGALEENCVSGTRRMSAIMDAKGIPHKMNLWGYDTPHGWPSWRRMANTYIPMID
jgi:esterase/lipase superfamily enzyme